ncbi:MarR family transcriptional regulator [Rhodococcus ruber]|uniref:MarR family transcriptional regulator n=1 Tax=Rhodococcus ruber TaxID=1830 RepID=A0ABT4M8B5_9NOCA|nr:MarR family transcriptional regulator [Rhodococcus ruber]MCZ4517178.1 MarR family transcriptional regulator [Rhodococcus ruber]
MDSVLNAMRRTSALSVSMRQALAQRSGMHVTDAECVDLLRGHDRLSAGDIAQATGLSKGAVTALIKRLRHADIVVTQVDEFDRRKVWVSVDTNRISAIVEEYRTVASETTRILDSYDDEQLGVIEDYNERLGDLYERLSNDQLS